MKRIFLLLFVMFMILIPVVHAEKLNENYQEVTSGSDFKVYIDVEKIEINPDKQIDFATLYVLTEKGKETFISNIPKDERETCKDIHSIEKFESFDVDRQRAKDNVIMLFDSKEKLIDISNKDRPWADVKEGTVEYSIICKLSQYIESHQEEILKRSIH